MTTWTKKPSWSTVDNEEEELHWVQDNNNCPVMYMYLYVLCRYVQCIAYFYAGALAGNHGNHWHLSLTFMSMKKKGFVFLPKFQGFIHM